MQRVSAALNTVVRAGSNPAMHERGGIPPSRFGPCPVVSHSFWPCYTWRPRIGSFRRRNAGGRYWVQHEYRETFFHAAQGWWHWKRVAWRP